MTTSHGRAAVQAEILADLPAVTDRIVGAVRQEIPTYDGLTSGQLEEVGTIAAWGTSRILDAWVHDGHLDDADLQRFRGIGSARAMDGRPLPGVLRAYRVAGTVVTDLVAERAHGRLDVDDAIALSRLWMASIDALSEALYAGHAEASDALDSDRARALTTFLDDLLLGRHATRSAVAARSQTLGVAMPASAHLIEVTSTDGHLATDDLTRLLARLGNGVAPIPARLRNGVGTALLAHLDPVTLGQGVNEIDARAVSFEVSLDGSVARVHRLCQHVLHAAPARAWHDRPVLGRGDVLALAQATGHPDQEPAALVRSVLGEVVRQRPLLEALEAFLSFGAAPDAADALGIHPQTLRHRLRRLRTLTGRDVRRPWDRFTLEIATLVLPLTPD